MLHVFVGQGHHLFDGVNTYSCSAGGIRAPEPAAEGHAPADEGREVRRRARRARVGTLHQASSLMHVYDDHTPVVK